MILGNGVRDGEPRRYLPGSRNGNGQSTQLARLMAREVGHGPGTPGSWSRLLVAHARWIVGVTLAVLAVAAVFAVTQTRLYASVADVVVEPRLQPEAARLSSLT